MKTVLWKHLLHQCKVLKNYVTPMLLSFISQISFHLFEIDLKTIYLRDKWKQNLRKRIWNKSIGCGTKETNSKKKIEE